MPTDNLKRPAAERDSIDVEKHTKTPRRRSEDGRLANYDWTKEEVGETVALKMGVSPTMTGRKRKLARRKGLTASDHAFCTEVRMASRKRR
eukprot:190287-Prymnesium_polylepis.1